MRVFALIPAAGKSVRMGRPKLTLPLGNRTVLERVLDAFRQAGVTDTLVVVGPEGAELGDIARRAGAGAHLLDVQTTDMRATVLRGLEILEERFHPSPTDAFFLIPADHPVVDDGVIRMLLNQATDDAGDASIWIPIHDGKRGHPALIRWSHVTGIRELPEGTGLNSYLRRQAHETREAPWDHSDVLIDLDTPEDYARLRARFE